MSKEWLSPNQERIRVRVCIQVLPGDNGWEDETLDLNPGEIEIKKTELTERLKKGEILDFNVIPDGL